MLHTLTAVALATPQHELLRLMDEVDADPIVAVSCEPVAPLTRVLETMELPGFDPQAAPDGSWLALLAPDRLGAAGVDVDESLSVLLFDDRKILVDVGFEGTEAQASALVATLLGLGPETREKFGWQDGHLVVGGRRLPGTLVDVTLTDDRLTLRAGIPTASGATPLREIVRSDDPGSGCTMTFDGPLPQSDAAKARGREATHVTGLVHLPLVEGEPAKARFSTHEPVPTALTTAPQPPVGGSTTERPAVLMSIGVSLGDLLLDPTLRSGLEIDETDVIELLSRVRFGHGTTVAFFADEPRLGYVANLDVTRSDGRPVPPRRARRVLQRVLNDLGLPTLRTSKTELSVRLARSTLWVATRPGGLVVGSDPTRVAETAQGEGTPWIQPAFAQLAAAHPVAMRSEGVETTNTLPPVAADLGIRTVQGLWEVTFGVHVEDDRRAATHAALAATIGAIVLPRIVPEDDAPRH